MYIFLSVFYKDVNCCQLMLYVDVKVTLITYCGLLAAK